MSAPKPELTAELRAIAERLVHDVFPSMDSQCAVRYIQQAESLVREVVEIVARKSAEIADRAISQDASGYASTAILNHWGLK